MAHVDFGSAKRKRRIVWTQAEIVNAWPGALPCNACAFRVIVVEETAILPGLLAIGRVFP
jgi:hypothetical protein